MSTSECRADVQGPQSGGQVAAVPSVGTDNELEGVAELRDQFLPGFVYCAIQHAESGENPRIRVKTCEAILVARDVADRLRWIRVPVAVKSGRLQARGIHWSTVSPQFDAPFTVLACMADMQPPAGGVVDIVHVSKTRRGNQTVPVRSIADIGRVFRRVSENNSWMHIRGGSPLVIGGAHYTLLPPVKPFMSVASIGDLAVLPQLTLRSVS